MKKYNKIAKCLLQEKYPEKLVFSNQHILMQTGDESDFDVDLIGNLDFNTQFTIMDIQSETPVNSLTELYQYCEENDIDIPSEYKTADGLICGGGKDFIINENLEGKWIED